MDWESETTEVIMQLIRPGDIVFDIGANLGYYTLLTAGAVGPAGQVHSFEPNPNLATVLIEAVKLNSYHDRVFINQIALSDRTQERAEFYISQLPQESGLSSLSPHPQWIQQGVFSPSNTILVDTITLDEYFVERHIERCDLVKIDVEGTEYHVIGGMRKVLRDIQPKFIICETRLGGEADTLIRQFGFVPYIITESGLKEAEQSSRVWGNILYVASSSCSYLP
jgi:FkbM family methyltransferase